MVDVAHDRHDRRARLKGLHELVRRRGIVLAEDTGEVVGIVGVQQTAFAHRDTVLEHHRVKLVLLEVKLFGKGRIGDGLDKCFGFLYGDDGFDGCRRKFLLFLFRCSLKGRLGCLWGLFLDLRRGGLLLLDNLLDKVCRFFFDCADHALAWNSQLSQDLQHACRLQIQFFSELIDSYFLHASHLPHGLGPLAAALPLSERVPPSRPITALQAGH